MKKNTMFLLGSAVLVLLVSASVAGAGDEQANLKAYNQCMESCMLDGHAPSQCRRTTCREEFNAYLYESDGPANAPDPRLSCGEGCGFKMMHCMEGYVGPDKPRVCQDAYDECMARCK